MEIAVAAAAMPWHWIAPPVVIVNEALRAPTTSVDAATVLFVAGR